MCSRLPQPPLVRYSRCAKIRSKKFPATGKEPLTLCEQAKDAFAQLWKSRQYKMQTAQKGNHNRKEMLERFCIFDINKKYEKIFLLETVSSATETHPPSPQSIWIISTVSLQVKEKHATNTTHKLTN